MASRLSRGRTSTAFADGISVVALEGRARSRELSPPANRQHRRSDPTRADRAPAGQSVQPSAARRSRRSSTPAWQSGQLAPMTVKSSRAAMTKTTWQTSREHVTSTKPSDAAIRVGMVRRAPRRAHAVKRAPAVTSPALEALSRAPRLLQRGLLTREDLLHPIIDTLQGVIRYVTDGLWPPGGALASHTGPFLAPSHVRRRQAERAAVPGDASDTRSFREQDVVARSPLQAPRAAVDAVCGGLRFAVQSRARIAAGLATAVSAAPPGRPPPRAPVRACVAAASLGLAARRSGRSVLSLLFLLFMCPCSSRSPARSAVPLDGGAGWRRSAGASSNAARRRCGDVTVRRPALRRPVGGDDARVRRVDAHDRLRRAHGPVGRCLLRAGGGGACARPARRRARDRTRFSRTSARRSQPANPLTGLLGGAMGGANSEFEIQRPGARRGGREERPTVPCVSHLHDEIDARHDQYQQARSQPHERPRVRPHRSPVGPSSRPLGNRINSHTTSRSSCCRYMTYA